MKGLLATLAMQTRRPDELLVVDGSEPEDRRTEHVIAGARSSASYQVRYVRGTGGAALQRNIGIDRAVGDFVALIDDDVRLAPTFFENILATFETDLQKEIGCIAGCLSNEGSNVLRRVRWSVYRALGLLTTTAPGAFDRGSGHAVPRILEDPGDALRRVDLVGAGCAVWRRAVFDSGVRFSPFFRTYSYNEDFHLSLVAGADWKIFDLGRARFTHLSAASGRPSARLQAAHRVINSRFIFVDVVPLRTWAQELRFWLLHGFELLGRAAAALTLAPRHGGKGVLGYAEGMRRAYRYWPGTRATSSPADRSDEI